MEKQLTLWESIEIDDILLRQNKCITCDRYNPKGKKGTYPGTRNILFPCNLAEYHYMDKEEDYSGNCHAYRPNVRLYDCCGSCKYKNCFMHETNYCSNKEQPNYHFIEKFKEYCRTDKSYEHNLFEFCYKYYLCDNYTPNERRTERIK